MPENELIHELRIDTDSVSISIRDYTALVRRSTILDAVIAFSRSEKSYGLSDSVAILANLIDDGAAREDGSDA